jgi:hypothetical protein
MSETPIVQPMEMSLNYVWMLPPDYKGLRQSLETKGYTLKQQIRGSLILIAKKGTVEILVNPERRVLAIGSETSSKDILLASEDLEKAYLEIGMEASNLIFIEFLGNYSFQSTASPLKKLNALKIEGDLLPKIGAVLGKDIVTVGLRLTTKDSNPTSMSWLNLNIEPLYPSANKSYLITIVFRGLKEEVLEFVKYIEKRIPKIIEKIEESPR